MEKEEYGPFELPEEIDSINTPILMESLINIHQNKKRKQEYVMQEYRPNIKRKISNDKLKTSKINIQTMKSSKILDQDSTKKDVVSKPFWNEFTKEQSKKLWLPTKIDCVDMDLNSLNSSSRKLIQNSWFSVKVQKNKTPLENSQTISLPSVITLSPRKMECDQQKTEEKKSNKKKKKNKPSAGKVRKIRLFPNERQKEILMRWFGTTRWTYNQCLTAVEKEKIPKDKDALRLRCLNSECFQNKNKWVLKTPYDVRDEGMNDLLKAYMTNFSKKNPTKFKIKYRSKKNESESIVIHSKHWKKAGVFYPNFFGKEPIRASEPLPDKLEYDSRLQRTRLGEFYLCIPKPLEVKGDNQAPKWTRKEEGILSIDPGVRTFATGYSPSGLSIEWGKNDIGRIYRLCYKMDKLQSRWSQKEVRHRERYRLKKSARRIRKKIRNLIYEVHKKFAKWIVEQYHTVLLPEFQTQNMVKKGQRKIKSKTARAMLTWSHYRFRQRLLNKTREYPWCKVILCDEHYTSKTCGNCGNIQNIGGSKVYKCKNCRVEMDRDVNGARNILLRYLTLSQTP